MRKAFLILGMLSTLPLRLSELVGSFLGESHLLDGTVNSGLNVLPVHVVLFPANFSTVEFRQDSLLGVVDTS